MFPGAWGFFFLSSINVCYVSLDKSEGKRLNAAEGAENSSWKPRAFWTNESYLAVAAGIV